MKHIQKVKRAIKPWKVITDRQAVGVSMHFPWGVAWQRYECRAVVFIWVPFNWMVGWGREVWYRLLSGPRRRWEKSVVEQLEREYSTGFGAGYKDGEKAAWKQVERFRKIIEEQATLKGEEDGNQ